MKNPEFLKKKYTDLHNTPEVVSASKHAENQTDEKVSQNPSDRIQNYLDRLERLVLDPDKEQSQKRMPGGHGDIDRPRALSLLREKLMNKYVRLSKDRMAQAASNVEERAARDLGIQAEYGEEQLEQRGDIAVKDLEKSLDQWIDYLSDPKEPYPVWFRYYAFRNILDLGDYDKDKGEFGKRSAGQIRLFPDIDRGALAYAQNIIECAKDSQALEQFQQAQAKAQTPSDQFLTKEKAEAFSKQSFAKQYAEGIKEAGEITPELRAETRGEWIKYSQNSDPTPLWSSLQRKGTAWCTKGFATAETQLKGGDFYVYYTLDKQGNPTIPRIAIRMEGDHIFETRGVADNQQNLEGNMTDIAEEKMSTLPGKEKYQKISRDMKQMTAIYKRSFQENKDTAEKTYLNPSLTRDELIFLYEINSKIKGFGYQRDPRIKELLDQRNLKEDALIVFDYKSEQIAYSEKELNDKEKNKNIKAYIGVWNPDVLKNLPKNIEHVYESFPDKKVFLKTIETDPNINSPKTYEKELLAKGFKIYDTAKKILQKTPFSQESKEYDLVSFSVESLGFPNGATTEQIYTKAQELGLDICPAEVGPLLRLNYSDQPNGEYLWVAMKDIKNSDGYSHVFHVLHDHGVRWLYTYWYNPGHIWSASFRIVFLRRK